MSASCETISSASGGCPAVPTIKPPSLVRSTSAPAAALRSMISWTRAACAAGYPTTRPTIPFGPITAMLGWTPSAVPRSIVISRMPGVAFGFPPMTCAAIVGNGAACFKLEELGSFAVRAASARCSCIRTSRSASCCFSAWFSSRAPRSSA